MPRPKPLEQRSTYTPPEQYYTHYYHTSSVNGLSDRRTFRRRQVEMFLPRGMWSKALMLPEYDAVKLPQELAQRLIHHWNEGDGGFSLKEHAR